MENKIARAFHDLVLNKKAVPQIAVALDVAPSTVYSWLNYYAGNKLSVDEAMAIADELGDYSPFINALHARGFQVLRSGASSPILSEENIYKVLTDLMVGTGCIADAVKSAMGDDKLDKEELARIFELASGAHETLMRMRSGAQKAAYQN